ncbi:MAG: PadR family transcriptional regulator [Candidatus Thorarchaeota archaeon]|jgi:DNA-binding PadR family transcriptional regulator
MATAQEPCDDNLKDVQFVPRGFLKLLIARLLAKRELTGSQIMSILEDRSKGKWRPSPGSIYPLLSSLEEHELIMTVRTEGRSKIYTLSPKGHEHFKETFRRKVDVEDRTRLHRTVWMQMLDPSDQAIFHAHGIQMAIAHLGDVHSQLTDNQKLKLRNKLTKAQGLIEELIKILGD